MKRIATTVRCVPRYGYANTEVRAIDLDLPEDPDHEDMQSAINVWFAQRGISDALYDVAVDNEGFFAIVNDEVFEQEWGTPLL